MLEDVRETVMMVSVGTVPGTDLERLAHRISDAVVDLPVPAAVMLGTLDALTTSWTPPESWVNGREC